MEEMVWHYAPGLYLSEMVQAGFLRPSNAGATAEYPMLWFSANQKWEPTATKLVESSRGMIRLTFEQQAARLGCIRFGLPAGDPRLLTWGDACRAANTPREQRRAMEKLGKKLGAKSADWFATVLKVNLSELRFQVWEFDRRWQPAQPAEMAGVWNAPRPLRFPNSGQSIAAAVQPWSGGT